MFGKKKESDFIFAEHVKKDESKSIEREERIRKVERNTNLAIGFVGGVVGKSVYDNLSKKKTNIKLGKKGLKI